MTKTNTDNGLGLWKEFFVKITPRKKGHYAGIRMGNDYNNHKTANDANTYNENTCKNIVAELNDHYKDFDIDTIDVCDNQEIIDLENKIDELESENTRLKQELSVANEKLGMRDYELNRVYPADKLDRLEQENKSLSLQVERLERAIDVVKGCLDNLDGAIIPGAVLDSLAKTAIKSSIQTTKNEIQKILSDKE